MSHPVLRLRTRLRTRRRASGRRERGATFIMVALSLGFILVAAALAVDLGRLNAARRDVQAAADVIALDLSRLVDGRTLSDILDDPISEADERNEYTYERLRAADANDVDPTRIVDTYGVWDRVTRTFTPYDLATHGGLVPNAVQVTVSDTLSYFFQPGGNSTSRTAVVVQRNLAHLSLGSKFANLNPCVFEAGEDAAPCNIDTQDADALDAYLRLLSGNSDVSLGALTYAGLLTANVTLGDLAVAGGFGSVEEFMAAEITPGQAAAISAAALENNGDAARAEYFVGLSEIGCPEGTTPAEDPPEDPTCDDVEGDPSLGPPTDRPVTPGDIYDVELVGAENAAYATINLFDFYTATLEAANLQNAASACTGTTDRGEITDALAGDPTADTGVTAPPTDFGAFAVVSDQLCADVVSARKDGIGDVGDAAVSPPELHTAQVDVTHTSLVSLGGGDYGFGVPFEAPPETGPAADLLPPAEIAGLAIPISGDLEIPVSVSGAGGTARLMSIECDESENLHRIDAQVDPRPAYVQVGNYDESGNALPIGTLALTDPVTGASYTVTVTIDKETAVIDQAPYDVFALNWGDSDSGDAAPDPFVNLDVDPDDIILTFDPPLPGVPAIPPVPPLPPLPGPPVVGLAGSRATRYQTSSTTTTTTTTTTTAPTTSTSTSTSTSTTTSPVPTFPTTTVPPTTVPSTTVPPTTTTLPVDIPDIPDDLAATIDDVVSALVADAVATANALAREQLSPILGYLGLGVTANELTNVGIGRPIRDEFGSVTDLDIFCTLPTLVE